jgi:hypothetical protein
MRSALQEWLLTGNTNTSPTPHELCALSALALQKARFLSRRFSANPGKRQGKK